MYFCLQEEELGGYKVVRKADGQKPQTFVFPENIKIAPRQKIKVNNNFKYILVIDCSHCKKLGLKHQ